MAIVKNGKWILIGPDAAAHAEHYREEDYSVADITSNGDYLTGLARYIDMGVQNGHFAGALAYREAVVEHGSEDPVFHMFVLSRRERRDHTARMLGTLAIRNVRWIDLSHCSKRLGSAASYLF